MNAFVKASLAVALSLGCAGISAPASASQWLAVKIENKVNGYKLHASEMKGIDDYPANIESGSSGIVTTSKQHGYIEYFSDKYNEEKDGNNIVLKETICLATATFSYKYANYKCENISVSFTSTKSACGMSKVSCSSSDCSCIVEFTSTW